MSKKKKIRSGKSKAWPQTTPLRQHHRNGKILSPPLATLPNLKLASWLDNRLPEVLWAALLTSCLPREHALTIFRSIANIIMDFPGDDKPYDIRLSALASAPIPLLESFLSRIIDLSPLVRPALRPLLLLESLPAYGQWAAAIAQTPEPDDWNKLAAAVARSMFHQSQEATDCRWLMLICMGAGGKLHVNIEELVREFNNYPDYGDMRKVRPAIRSAEGALASTFSVSPWPDAFWKECLAKTRCFPLVSSTSEFSPVKATSVTKIREVRDHLICHAFATATTTSVDAVHDTTFGLALFSLAILEELLHVAASFSISARAALRTLVEIYVTLSYLICKKDPGVWTSFRVYGSGQAKLAFLKLDELGQGVNFVTSETLTNLANDDLWDEFLSIDIGHWANANLRQLSEESGTKDVYDRFYPWSSAYAHAHWGPVRDVVFDTCGNALHRLHRIPRSVPRVLPDLVPDASEVVDLILDKVSEVYPGFHDKITITS